METNIQNIISDNKKQVDNIEIYFYESESTPIEFKNNLLFSLDKKYSTGMGVRVIHRGKLGASSTNDLNKINETIKAAKESSIYGEKINFDFPEDDKRNLINSGIINNGLNINNLAIYDKEFENPDNEVFINSILEGISKIIKKDNSIKCEANLKFIKFKITIVNSNGLFKEYKKSIMSSDIIALLLEKEGGFQWLYDFYVNTHKVNSIDKITESIIKLLDYSKKIIQIKTDNLPVIFMPSCAHIFFESLKLAANGNTLQKGISPLSEKIGKKVLDKRLTIIDDPLLKSMYGSMPFDCEGTSCRKNIIFKDGLFQDHIFDLETASRLNKNSTGNAVRSYSSKPYPGYTNFIVSNGKTKISEMIKNLKKGIIVHELIGAGQSNLLSGDYSVNIGLGFYIENGEITGRIKNAMIAGNVYEDLLNNIDDISTDTKSIEGNLLPAILLKEKKIVA